MLALETTGDGWGSAEIEISDGVTTDTWTGSADTLSAVAAMDELAAWATSTFAPTFTWTWARDATTGGAIFTLSASANFTIEPLNSTAEDLFGLDPGVKSSASSQPFDSAAIATWAPVSGIAVRTSLRQLGRGDAPGDGAVRPGVPGLAALRQSVGAVGTAIDAGRLAAALALATSPRRIDVYQQHTGTWLRLALGDVSRSPSGFMHYRFDMAATGDAI